LALTTRLFLYYNKKNPPLWGFMGIIFQPKRIEP
jgi:hypothetical protein